MLNDEKVKGHQVFGPCLTSFPPLRPRVTFEPHISAASGRTTFGPFLLGRHLYGDTLDKKFFFVSHACGVATDVVSQKSPFFVCFQVFSVWRSERKIAKNEESVPGGPKFCAFCPKFFLPEKICIFRLETKNRPEISIPGRILAI